MRANRRWAVAAAAVAFGLSGVALGALISISPSGGNTSTTPHFAIRQFRCDVSASIAGSGSVGGETCATGDWWGPLDARGARAVTLSGWEYGTGSGQWSLYNCIRSPGAGTGTIAVPGVEDPAEAPDPTDPDPLCTKINVDNAGDPVPLTGTGVKEIHWTERTFDYLIIRTDDCTGNCDATLQLQADWD